MSERSQPILTKEITEGTRSIHEAEEPSIEEEEMILGIQEAHHPGLQDTTSIRYNILHIYRQC